MKKRFTYFKVLVIFIFVSIINFKAKCQDSTNKYTFKIGGSWVNEVNFGVNYRISSKHSIELTTDYLHPFTKGWRYNSDFSLYQFLLYYLQRQINTRGYRVNVSYLFHNCGHKDKTRSLEFEYTYSKSNLFYDDNCRTSGSCYIYEFNQKMRSLGILYGKNRFLRKNNKIKIYYKVGLSLQINKRNYTKYNPGYYFYYVSPGPQNVIVPTVYLESRFGINYYFK